MDNTYCDIPREELAELHARGHSARDIAKRLGVSSSTIDNHLLRHGIKSLTITSNYRIDIDEDQLERLYLDGYSTYALAQHFGVSNTLILKRLYARQVPMRTAKDYAKRVVL